MKKKVMILVALVFAFSMILTACGDSGSTTRPETQTATATLEGDGPAVKACIDISNGYSVEFYHDGFSLFEGEYTDDTYPLATGVILAEGVYEQNIKDYQESESYMETDGVVQFITGLEERNYQFMVEDKVPFSISFEKSVDEATADEIVEGITMSLE